MVNIVDDINIQITYLNTITKTRIAPSKIHGVGIFAIRNLEAGEKLHADEFPKHYLIPFNAVDKLLPEVKELIVEQWPQIANNQPFMWPTTRLQAFMNHSRDANYDARRDVMLKDIKAGEEIFEDYQHIEGWQKVWPPESTVWI